MLDGTVLGTGEKVGVQVDISKGMVERAARAWWAHESDSDVAWVDVIEPVRNGYRARAYEALAAALDKEYRREA